MGSRHVRSIIWLAGIRPGICEAIFGARHAESVGLFSSKSTLSTDCHLLLTSYAMSDLPRYQRLPDEEQGYGRTTKLALEGDDADTDREHTGGGDVPSYPPIASGTWQGPFQKKRVELWFLPRWPLKGEAKVVIGTIGATREARPAIRGFS